MTQALDRNQRAEELLEEMGEHVSAIEAVLRQKLADRAGEATPPKGLKVTFAVSARGKESDSQEEPPEVRADWYCWSASYVCGHGASGYIMCEKTVCEHTEVQ